MRSEKTLDGSIGEIPSPLSEHGTLPRGGTVCTDSLDTHHAKQAPAPRGVSVLTTPAQHGTTPAQHRTTPAHFTISRSEMKERLRYMGKCMGGIGVHCFARNSDTF